MRNQPNKYLFLNCSFVGLLLFSVDHFSAQSVGIGSVQFVPLQTLEVRGDITIDNPTTDAAFRIGNIKVLYNKGTNNLFVGNNAGPSNSGSQNTFIGHTSAALNNSGADNVFVGYNTGAVNTTGSGNIFVGKDAGYANQTGSNNIYVGIRAGGCTTCNSTTSDNIAIGRDAGYYSGTGSSTRTIMIGAQAGKNNYASDNIFIGYQAGFGAGITGTDNIFIGKRVGQNVISGTRNTIIGSIAADGGTFGGSSDNVIIGYDAVGGAAIGGVSTIIGVSAGYYNATTVSNNTFIGYNAGYNATGINNTFLGHQAGNVNIAGANNTYLGYNANGTAALTNATAIGYNASVTASNSFILGDGTVKVGIGSTAPNNTLEVAAVSSSVGVGGALGAASTGYQFLNYGVQHAGFRWTGGSTNIVLEDASSSSDPGGWYSGATVNFIVRNGKVGIGSSTPNSTLDVNGSVTMKRTATAANYVVLTTDYYVGVTNTAAARTITLPAAATAATGKMYIIKDESGGALINNITVAGNGAENIDGANTKVINTNYGSVKVICDGTQWFTF